MEHLIELRDVYKIYQMGDEAVHALDGISLTVDPGEFVAIVGQSGSGKSTAMNIIGCLDVPTSGTYHLAGVDVSTMDDDQQAEIRNKMLGFIFQQYNLIPKLNVQENVELPPAVRESIGVVPLALPLMAGPGAISSTIVWGTRYHSISYLFGFFVAIALFALCCWGLFRMAPWLVRVLRQTGINVITRIMGLLLMALGIEFIVTGIKGIFPGLLN